LTKRSTIFFLFSSLFALAAVAVFPQSADNVESENASLQAAAASTGPGKRDALVSLARLSELQGEDEPAAAFWLQAGAIPAGTRGAPGTSDCLLRAARLYISIGSYEQAGRALDALAPTMKEVIYLRACIKAFQIGDVHDLAALSMDPGYREFQPAAYYTLWRLTASPIWEGRLVNECPQSAEAAIARGKSGGSAVGGAQTAQWLLFPGRSVAVASADARAADRAAAQSKAEASDNSPPVLQTGLFEDRGNADVQAKQLQKAGFKAQISRRRVHDKEYWVVAVPAGSDMNHTILALKSAGFESFPSAL
jgi:hypothetical protein